MRHIDIREPERVWLTADWHLSRDGSAQGMDPIRRMGRPYSGCGEIRRHLIGATGESVNEGDMLIVLGDLVALDVHDDSLDEILDGLPECDTHLVLGNHDEGVSEGAWRMRFGDGNVHDCLELVLPDIENEAHDGSPLRIMCFHYPMETWKGERFGNINLHGHLHAFRPYNEEQRSRGKRRYDVGIDANGFAPVRLSDILSFMGIPSTTCAKRT